MDLLIFPSLIAIDSLNRSLIFCDTVYDWLDHKGETHV
jgi:hypothetical protein